MHKIVLILSLGFGEGIGGGYPAHGVNNGYKAGKVFQNILL